MDSGSSAYDWVEPYLDAFAIAMVCMHLIFLGKIVYDRVQRMRARRAARRSSGGESCDGDSQDMLEESAKLIVTRRVQIARRTVGAAWVGFVIVTLWAAYEIFFDGGFPHALVLSESLLLIALTLMGLFPETLVNERTLPMWHIVAMVCSSFAAPTAVDAVVEDPLRACQMAGALLFAGLYLRFPFLVVSNAGVASYWLLAAWSSGAKMKSELIMHLTTFITKLIVFYVADRALTLSVQGEVRARFEKCQQTAVSALLGLVCDAVVDTDDGLNMAAHSDQLAGLLMHGGGRSLQGASLADFVFEGEDRDRFEEMVSQGPGTRGAGMTPLRLRDCIGNCVKVVAFHVPYRNLNGRMRHLVGFQENITDGGLRSDAMLRTVRTGSLDDLEASLEGGVLGLTSEGSELTMSQSSSESVTEQTTETWFVDVSADAALPVTESSEGVKQHFAIEPGSAMRDAMPGQATRLFEKIAQILHQGDRGRGAAGLTVAFGDVELTRKSPGVEQQQVTWQASLRFPAVIPEDVSTTIVRLILGPKRRGRRDRQHRGTAAMITHAVLLDGPSPSSSPLSDRQVVAL